MRRENICTSGKHVGKWQLLVKHWSIRSIIGILAPLLMIFGSTTLTALAAPGDWPTYVFDNGRSGFNSSETSINPTTASHLKLHWTHTAAGAITTQPVEANNLIYWGSWDAGFEHATNLTNGHVWTIPLGTTTDTSCNPVSVGVASTSTVATINGRSMLFVGGGNAHFYALDALNGSTIWNTSLGSSPSHFIWSSPAVYNGSVYIGLASFGDCPLVQGQMIQLNASTGAIQHTFNVVPNNCTGGGVSGSPTIDQAAGKLYFATGNGGSCGSSEPYAIAMVELNASDLTFVDSWPVPSSEQVPDSDFVNTPTLFTGSGGTPMVGVANKNGKFYAFNRSSISRGGSGPVWKAQIAIGGDCPQCGNGSISPAAWDGTTLYAAGGSVSINGSSCKGSVSALNPATGAFIWRHCLFDGAVLAAVTLVPGLVVACQGRYVMVFSASSGATLFRFFDGNSGSAFWGAASISNGVLYVGNIDGHLYAIGT
jgi:polyvinyl alcohol dehydrogenase (cytochrome)